jgi:hypothetical protein
MTKNLPTVGRGVNEYRREVLFCGSLGVFRQENKKERNCPKKFVTGVKEEGKRVPENTVF